MQGTASRRWGVHFARHSATRGYLADRRCFREGGVTPRVDPSLSCAPRSGHTSKRRAAGRTTPREGAWNDDAAYVRFSDKNDPGRLLSPVLAALASRVYRVGADGVGTAYEEWPPMGVRVMSDAPGTATVSVEALGLAATTRMSVE